MISDFPAIVDACVLVQAAVRDTLLRLFERRLFLARWSDEIIEETVRTLRDKLSRTQEQTDRLVNELRTYFPDAWVEPGYRELIPITTNHEEDRHVLAAAVKTPCEVIVTYNLKDFPEQALKPFGIEAKHPDEFLIDLYQTIISAVRTNTRSGKISTGTDLPRPAITSTSISGVINWPSDNCASLPS
jgi:hypothetical protein